MDFQEVKKILILPEVDLQKYHDEDKPMPFEATPQMVKKALEIKLPTVTIEIAEDWIEAENKISSADIVLTDRFPKNLLNKAKNLKWIHSTTTGIDHFFKPSGIEPDDLKSRNIMLINSPGVSRIPAAEHAMALMLSLSRGVHTAIRQQLKRQWRIFCADELSGKTCGIIGIGHIGSHLAVLAKAFGMKVTGTREDPKNYNGPADSIGGPEQNEMIIRDSDYLVLACGLSQSTYKMMGEDQFKQMKPTAYLINISRGENVDEQALVKALRNKEIAGAGLDVFGPLDKTSFKLMEALSPDSELWDMENVIITPNNAASTPRYLEYYADMVSENYYRAKNGEPFINRIV